MTNKLKQKLKDIRNRIGRHGTCGCRRDTLPIVFKSCNLCSPLLVDTHGRTELVNKKVLPLNWLEKHPGYCPVCELPVRNKAEIGNVFIYHINYEDKHDGCEACHQAGHPVIPCPMLIGMADTLKWPSLYEKDTNILGGD